MCAKKYRRVKNSCLLSWSIREAAILQSKTVRLKRQVFASVMSSPAVAPLLFTLAAFTWEPGETAQYARTAAEARRQGCTTTIQFSVATRQLSTSPNKRRSAGGGQTLAGKPRRESRHGKVLVLHCPSLHG